MGDEVMILTAEHYTLQMTRQACLQDMQGRASLFLTAVSGAIVAIGFLARAGTFPYPVNLSVIALLGLLWILGALTFVRIAQIAVEDAIVAFGIARIRHRYIELSPGLQDVIIRSVHDDMLGMAKEMGGAKRWWQPLMPTSILVSVVASAVLGALVVMSAATVLRLGLGWSLVSGVIAAGASLIGNNATGRRMWADVERSFPPRFPSPTESK